MLPRYIRFDWAMKRLLRNRANYAVLEGFLSVLLGEKIKIERFLGSESNQENESDKFNRVDMLAESEKGELLISEVQNTRELAYFHRMLYGVSKAVTEYIGTGNPYDKVRKVYSINIVYFEIGQGKDYVYHGRTDFRGLHYTDDILQLSVRQQEYFIGKAAGDIFPEYYVLRVNDFDKVAITPLDEWMEFFKTAEIDPHTQTPGLPEARECLRVDSLSEEERKSYYRSIEDLRYQQSVIETGRIEGFADGKAEGIVETAKKLKSLGVATDIIIQATGLSAEEMEKL